MGTELPDDLGLQTKSPDTPKAAIVGLKQLQKSVSLPVANAEQHLAVVVLNRARKQLKVWSLVIHGRHGSPAIPNSAFLAGLKPAPKRTEVLEV